MPDSVERPNLFFRLVVPAGGLFVVTILALTSTIFGNPEAPMNQWLTEYGGTLIVAEVVLFVVVGFLAMAVDRWKTLRQASRDDSGQPPKTTDS